MGECVYRCADVWFYQGVVGLGSVSRLGKGLGSGRDGERACEVGLGKGLGSGRTGERT